MIKGINLDKFKQYNFLYVENILYGIENYKHICFTADYKNYKLFIKMMIEENKKSFLDFYFSNIQENEKQLFYNFNNYDNILKRFKFEKDKIYFDINNLDDEIIDFIIEISYEEILFSTFYFEEPKITLWTNYNKQFILFFENNINISKYKLLAKNLNLKILFEKI